MEKIKFEDFIKTYPDINDFDEETATVWRNRHQFTFIQQMSDVWGEAEKCISLKNNGEQQQLERQVKVFVNTVNAVLTDPKLTKGSKEELRASEWELLDYCVWNNECKNKDPLGWFDQWMYDYNFDLRA